MHSNFFVDTLRFVPKNCMKPTDGLDEFIARCLTLKAKVLWSIKKDGVRDMVVVHENGLVEQYSRNKKLFPNFSRFDHSFRAMADVAHKMRLSPYPVVFDGEMISKDKRFSGIMTQVYRKHNIDSSIFEFNLFDLWMWNTSLSKRIKACELVMRACGPIKDVCMIDHHELPVLNAQDMIAIVNDVKINQGFEGAVFKIAESVYENKDTRLWCRVKQTDNKPPTEDLPVVEINISKKGKYKGIVGSLVVDRNGVKVNVSGMTDDQRVEFLTNTPKLIEVEFMEVTEKGSLRHPRVVRVRDDKDEVSINAAFEVDP